ncbi:E3 ubiquitin-protein ligase TRIM56-like [Littorina saxatilis]|uniref:Uncharacterized protein n=1 Tax=Littorina saxatilis TaxID=31220 RepID=A0AAN9BJ60_9CAEN
MASLLPAQSRHRECAMCLGVFTSPRILQCFHTFCVGCLKQLVRKHVKSGSFPCPTCRTSVQIPAGGVDKFQVNFYIQAEVEGLRSTSGKVATCEMCGKGSASHKCSDCDQLSCDACTAIHASIKATRSHTVLNLQQASGSLPGLTVSKERFCKTHKDEKIRFFCTQCSAVICRDCKLTSHEGHISTDLSEKSAEAKSLILQVTNRAHNYLEPKLRAALQTATSHKAAAQTNQKEMESTLERRAEELKREIDGSLAEAKEKLSQEASDVARVASQCINHMTQELTSFVSFTEHAQRVAESGCDADVLEIPNEMKQFFGVASDEACAQPYGGSFQEYFGMQIHSEEGQYRRSQLPQGNAGWNADVGQTMESAVSASKLKSFTSEEWNTVIQLEEAEEKAQCCDCSCKYNKDLDCCPECGAQNECANASGYGRRARSYGYGEYIPGATYGQCQNCCTMYDGNNGCPGCGAQHAGSHSDPLTTIKTAIPHFIGHVTRSHPSQERAAPGQQKTISTKSYCSEITSEIGAIQMLLSGRQTGWEQGQSLPDEVSEMGWQMQSLQSAWQTEEEY